MGGFEKARTAMFCSYRLIHPAQSIQLYPISEDEEKKFNPVPGNINHAGVH